MKQKWPYSPTPPWIDRAVYNVIGVGLFWLGKRAIKRHDQIMLTAAQGALMHGDIDVVRQMFDRISLAAQLAQIEVEMQMRDEEL